MNQQTAYALVQRIQNYWGHAINPAAQTDWLDVLDRLHEGTAGTALQRLIATQPDRAPSIAQFLAAYRALDTASIHQRIDCGTCGGDGWRKAHPPECPDPSREDCGHNCPLTACHCDAGGPNRDVLRRINEHRPKPRPVVVADPMAAARGRAIAERAQGAERARLATFRVGTHVNDIEEAS